MIKIRLKRYGRKHKPSYRIIAIDSRSKREGKALEELGFYDPLKKRINFKSFASILNRLRQGAQITNTVYHLLNQEIRTARLQPFRYKEDLGIKWRGDFCMFKGFRYIPQQNKFIYINNRAKFPTFDQQFFSIKKRRNRQLFLNRMVKIALKRKYLHI